MAAGPGTTLTPASQLAGIAWPAVPADDACLQLALLFQLEQTQWWPPELLLAHQLWQAQLVIDHAARTVPLYRGRLDGAADLPPGHLTYEAFRELPLLRRRDLQTAPERALSRDIPTSHGALREVRTSGSTGTPVEVRTSAVEGWFASTLGLRYHLWHRRDLRARNVTIKTVAAEDAAREAPWAPCYPTGPGHVWDIAQPVGVLLERLLDTDPEYLQVHPSTLRGMIKRSREIGRRPHRLREVRTFGEVVEDELRELCRAEWGVPLTDNYSAEELGIIALQCPEQPHYHVQAESVLVEVLDGDGNPCAPGQRGRVVCTALHNVATPLIRYELGDLAEVGDACPCGRGLPVLRRIIGRVRNLVTLPTGEQRHPVFREDRMLAIAPIRQYQLIQRSLTEIDVFLVTERPLGADEERALASYFSRQFGLPVRVPLARSRSPAGIGERQVRGVSLRSRSVSRRCPGEGSATGPGVRASVLVERPGR